MLREQGISLGEAAQLVCELVNCVGMQHAFDMQECVRRLQDAREVLRESNPKLTLEEGVKRLLEAKMHRREATRRELAYYTGKILRNNPKLAAREMRHISSRMCLDMLEQTFAKQSCRHKARIILHGLFAYCCRMGWLKNNPVCALPMAPLPEKEKRPLSLHEITRLLRTALLPKHRACAAAVGIMLWGGVRPAEVMRLRWGDIHFESRSITLYAAQSKTGGSRIVSMSPPLIRWLRRNRGDKSDADAICPRGWIKRWGELHRACGLHPWVPDVLRHSFASYHAAHYRDLASLQYEMGHRSQQMLRFRYISANGITRQTAAAFWSAAYWEKNL